MKPHLALLLVLCSACAVVPEPTVVGLQASLSEDDVELVLLVLRNQGYQVAATRRQPTLDIEGAWSPYQRESIPGWKRVKVREHGGALQLTVHVRYMNLDLFERPYFTEVEIDRDLEDALFDGLQEALSAVRASS